MAKKSKLLSALDAHKGRSFKLEKQKKLQRAAEKRKHLKTVEQEEDESTAESDAEAGQSETGGAALQVRICSRRALAQLG